MKTTILCILDGWGLAQPSKYNALSEAKLPFWNKIIENYPSCSLEASGEYVGLPKNQMGNSEVGHMNIGSGRVVLQELPRINDSFNKSKFIDKTVFRNFIEEMKLSKGACHIMGLLSDGGVHSHKDHLIKMISTISKLNIPVLIHAFLDGRDTEPTSALEYISELEKHITKIDTAKLASISGRFYSMDRDNRWDRIKKSFDTIIYSEGARYISAQEAIIESYSNDVTDEFVSPACIGNYEGFDTEKDGIMMMNFRSDRARQILTALTSDSFCEFDRGSSFTKIPRKRSVGMVEYSSTLKQDCNVLFDSSPLKNTLGEVVSYNQKKQLRLAETEKYAHVTFFMNGGREKEFEGEKRILVPSPKVKTYDQKPEMSADELTIKLINAIESKEFDLIIINYANPDMVGHTGNMKAAVRAAEAVDSCLEKVTKHVISSKSTMIVTADHGNLEKMYDEKTQKPHTAHTCNPVPCVIISEDRYNSLNSGSLSNIAPTILDIMKIDTPKEMDAKSLINHY